MAKGEAVIEALWTGTSMNMLLGGVGALIIQFLFNLPEFAKTLMWLGGAGVLTVVAGYAIQKRFERKKFKISVLAGGAAVGVVMMIIASNFASAFFPWARTDLGAALQGPGEVATSAWGMLAPAVIAVLMLTFIIAVVALGRKK